MSLIENFLKPKNKIDRKNNLVVKLGLLTKFDEIFIVFFFKKKLPFQNF
jgi:hypothetical protein